MDDYQRRYARWFRAKQERKYARTSRVIGMLIVGAALVFFLSTKNWTREQVKRREKVLVAKGTVLSAVAEPEPQMVVVYEQAPGKSVTRTFALEIEKDRPELMPTVGDSVLVSWHVDFPDYAYLMPLEYSGPQRK